MPILTLPIELTDEEYHYAADYEKSDSDLATLTFEDLADIAEGIADSDTGNYCDGDVATAELRARIGWPHD